MSRRNISKIKSGKALVKSSREFVQNDQVLCAYCLEGNFLLFPTENLNFTAQPANTTTVV